MTEILLAKNDRGAICNSILAALPEWFGTPSATASYVDHAENAPILIARVEGEIVGFVSLNEHFGINCKIHSVGVLPEHHRNGVGTALINAAALRATEKNFGFLTVKTLAPAHSDKNYAGTRAFYFSAGFRPFEESPELWGEHLSCLVLIKTLRL